MIYFHKDWFVSEVHDRKQPEVFNQGDRAAWTTYLDLTDHA